MGSGVILCQHFKHPNYYFVFKAAFGCGIAVFEGEVFVCCAWNYRVVVFGLDGSFVRQWGGKGNGEGQFKLPRALHGCKGCMVKCL